MRAATVIRTALATHQYVVPTGRPASSIPISSETRPAALEINESTLTATPSGTPLGTSVIAESTPTPISSEIQRDVSAIHASTRIATLSVTPLALWVVAAQIATQTPLAIPIAGEYLA